ncbi:MAG: acyl transferase [Saprospiraceae bacterium]|nr:acyl transferase [Saprospiraceae bacterium]
MQLNNIYSRIINLREIDFNKLCIEIFQFQAEHNPIYNQYIKLLKRDILKIHTIEEIPFLPIQFFKTHQIISGNWNCMNYFESSGTSGSIRSRHYIKNSSWYDKITLAIFSKLILSNVKSKFIFCGLLPGYSENPNSSLIKMLNALSSEYNDGNQPMIFNDIFSLTNFVLNPPDPSVKIIIFGVSFALFDWALEFQCNKEMIIIETGGMKTDKRSISKNQIYKQLKLSFKNTVICSEYGMTELFSQAYAYDGMKYRTPPWMRVLAVSVDDPFCLLVSCKRGRINIIDLANVDTCAFIQTDDTGIVYGKEFEILGRLQEEELRGCNFMID